MRRVAASRIWRFLSVAPYASLAFTLLACGRHPIAPEDAGGNGGSGEGGYAGVAGSGADGGGLGSTGASGYGGSDAGSDGGLTPYHALAVVTGLLHTCALLDDHNVKCWGENGYGQLGYGDARQRGGAPADMGDALPMVDLGTGHKAVKIAAGHYVTCAILEDSTLKCWGWAQLNGQPSKGDIGDQPGEMGDNLPPLSFGGRKVLNVAIGYLAACASLDDGTIWCWANSSAGIPQMVADLPSTSVKALSAVGNDVVALYEDGTVSHELPGGPFSDPGAGSNHRVLAISGTVGPTCEVLDDGTIACFVSGSKKTIVATVAATSVGVEYLSTICALFADGSVRCPPDLPDGQNCSPEAAYWCDPNGTIALGQGATAITNNGQDFTCALLADGGIKCWNFGGEVPAWLGSGVSLLSGTLHAVEYSPWNEVDLGSHR